MENNNFGNIQQFKNKKITRIILNIILGVGFLAIFGYYTLSAPFGNKDVIIHITNGQSIDSVSEELQAKKAIRNKLSLKIFIKILKSGKGIIRGDYLIKKNSPAWVIAWQIGRGKHNIEPIKIMIKEGSTNEEIANILADKLAGFRKDLFIAGTEDKQGYLFPDTYFFFPLDQSKEIIDKFLSNFKLKTNNIELGSKNISDIIIMASILEREASGENDINIISGILWKRISIGMPLQVDVDRSTYTKKGLPEKPINNSGMVSIKAAINPTDSPYLYYLHDKNGNVHYAKNFEEHKKNINNYLK